MIKLDRRDPQAWPHPAVAENRKADARACWTWREISEEHATYSLEVLPPIYVKGGFMVSEASDMTESGEPTYNCVARAGGLNWMCEIPRSQAQQAIEALRDHLEAANARAVSP